MPAEPAAYRPVIVIPVYNHPATVEDVVRRLLSTGTPVLLVDDASDPPAQEACERCRAMGAKLFIIMLTRLPAVLISRSTGWSPAPGLGSEHPQAHPSRSPSDDRSRT